MPEENFICKDCNYTNDTSGNCPYCDMPLEPLDPTKLDQTTGKPANYKKEEIDEVEEAVADDPEYLAPEINEEDELLEDDEFLKEEPEEDMINENDENNKE